MSTGSGQTHGGSALVAEFANRTGVVRWRREIPSDTGARYNLIVDVELAPDGGLVVAGPLGGFPVRKLSPDGHELWSAPVPVDMFNLCGGGVELDTAGDIVVHGCDGYGARYPIRDMFVTKLDGATGAALWTHLAQGVGSSAATQVSFDPDGDVIIAGYVHDETVGCPSFSILKRSGLDGSELWRRVIPGPVACGGGASLVAVDASGDVIAAGGVTNAYTDLFVVKVAGDDGSELWRYHVPQGDARGLALTREGDAVISASVRPNPSIGDSLRVVRLRGTDGSAVWARDLRGTHPTASNTQTYSAESLVAVGPGGEVFVGDSFTNLDSDRDLAVVRLDGETGAEDWRFIWDGGAWGGETARGVAVDSRGDLFVIGYTHTAAYGRGFSVFKLDGATGSMITSRPARLRR